MKKEHLIKNLAIIQAVLDKEVSADNMTAVEEKLNELATLMGLSAECCKWSRSLVLNKQSKLIESPKVDQLSPAKLKLWMEGNMAEELSVDTYADRINRALIHCSDSLRTIVSKYKAELTVSQYGNRTS